MTSLRFQETALHYKNLVESFLKADIYPLLDRHTPPTLASSIQYTLSAGGKRIRPCLTLASFQLSGDEIGPDALLVATSVECLHTYSLIHDDLPAMDNDDLRRGKPTCHKVYGEAVAILAGDSLNSLGFGLLGKVSTSFNDPQRTADLLEILHNGAGIPGMISGQILDLQSEGRIQPTAPDTHTNAELLHEIHNKKTGALIVASLLLGNRLNPNWEQNAPYLKGYGEELGLLFQITDDILDIEGTDGVLGKTAGKDKVQGKLTFVSAFGLEGAKQKKTECLERALEWTLKFQDRTQFFQDMANTIAQRKN